MKTHSPALEGRYRLKPEAHAQLIDDPVWRRIWAKLLTPPASSDQRISERLARYTADPADD